MDFQADEVFYQGNNDEQKGNDECSTNDRSKLRLFCLEKEGLDDQPAKRNQSQTNDEIVHYPRHQLH